jgi:hypothetical protein
MRCFVIKFILLFFTLSAFAGGKIQNQDVKSEAELIAAGSTKASLIRDSKIYVQGAGINDTLYNAITSGSISSGIPYWQTLTTYTVGKQVIEGDKIYRCTASHLSNVFATDSANWIEISSLNTLSLTGPVTSTGQLTSITNGAIDLSTKVNNILSFTNGGTGRSSTPSGSLLISNPTATGFDPVASGSSGNVLTSDGTKWTSAPPSGGAGLVPVTSGGTGLISVPSNNLLIGNGTNTMNVLAPGPTGSVLSSNGTSLSFSSMTVGQNPVFSATCTPVSLTLNAGEVQFTGFAQLSPNYTSDYTFTTSNLTVLKSGTYSIDLSVNAVNINSRVRIKVNGIQVKETFSQTASGNGDWNYTLTLNANDVITFHEYTPTLTFSTVDMYVSYKIQKLDILSGGSGTVPMVNGSSSTVTQTINWSTISNNYGVYIRTLNSATTTFNFTNAVAGQAVNIIVKQAGTGTSNLIWPAGVKWPGGITPVITTGIGKMDFFTIIYDGTDYWGSYVQNYN